jgi:Ca-activated chloride channel family protein
MVRFALIGVLAAVLAAAAQEPQVFRVALDNVPVYATVTDKTGRLVTNLTRDDFQLFDNGRSQPIAVFDNRPQPVRLIMMLDTSGSMSGNASLVRAVCDQLFANLRPDDEVKVGTFGNTITIMPAFTSDVVDLRAAVPATIPESAPTPLWRAVDQALGSFGDAAGRRVVLVLSDGKNQPAPGFGDRFVTVIEVIDRAQREDVMIYAVGLHSRYRGGASMRMGLLDDLPDAELPRAAEETGGGYFEVQPQDDLGAAFVRVAEELHSQYLLGFTPPAADGKLHRVEIKLTSRDLKPRARRRYLAPDKAS